MPALIEGRYRRVAGPPREIGTATHDARRPQYRLRVGEARVFYDVSGATVEILAIVASSEVESWLA